MIAGATVRLCRGDPRHAYECGDHTLYVGEVRALEIDRSRDKLSVYYAGRYRRGA
ncbi:MAG: flavin reductase family protein [Paracoccaceae bacterium]